MTISRLHAAALLLILGPPTALSGEEPPAGAAAAAGDKIEDVVFLKNGDRVTGEVKRLERGRLTLKTDSLGTVQIAWLDVARVASAETFEIETLDGTDYYGVLAEPEADDRLRVSGAEISIDLEAETVIRLTPIESSWLSRLDGSLTLGYTLTQADQTSQLSFATKIDQTTRKYRRSLDVSTIVTARDEAETTSYWNASFSNRRDLKPRTFFENLVKAQGNEELELDLRLLASAGYGWTLIQKSDRSLSFSTGLALSQEEAREKGLSETAWEGLILLRANRFWVHDPEIDLDLELALFPAISPSGGFRAELDASLTRELVNDLFLSISAFDFYDSDPLTRGATKNDYGLVTSIGWSF